MKRTLAALVTALLFGLAVPAYAQEWNAATDADRERYLEELAKRLPPLVYQDETPEQRRARLGTDEDPGLDPDPARLWHRFGKIYTIQKFERVGASYKDQPHGWVRPMWNVNIPYEIYAETLEHVWVWIEMTDKGAEEYSENVAEFYGLERDPNAEGPQVIGIPGGEAAAGDFRNTEYVKYTPEQLEFVKQIKPDFEELTPPASGVTVKFRESSEGLPDGGSWRNGLDVADMNGDGHPDLIVPPQRGGVESTTPFIFLGNGKGEWSLWRDARWPRAYNYGTVAAADVNGDGHQDVVIAAHLAGVFVALGDGKGNFTDSSEGLPLDFPTRRLVVRDANGDRRPDIFAIAEGPSLREKKTLDPPIRLYLNQERGTRWKETIVADEKRQVAGDWIAVADFDGDKRPDVAGSSIFFHGTDLFYLQRNDGSWQPFGRGWMPFYSYYTALTSGKFGSRKGEDVIMSYGRFWPDGADPSVIATPALTRMVGLEKVSFEGDKATRTPIARWTGTRAVWGLADGDFNGDRKRDIIYWHPETFELRILLGDGKGNFRTAEVDGVELPPRTTYDIKVADVNRDGKDDVVLMFETGGDRRFDGSIRVWLGAGSAEGKIASAK